MKTNVKEFHEAEFQLKLETIMFQLSDKDCQRVEFLRGMLSVYRDLIETRQGWVPKIITPEWDVIDVPNVHKIS